MSKKDVSALLGQKMLQGWTMLAESCPNPGCNVPLMERKRDSTIVCVSCDGQFQRGKDPHFPNQTTMVPKNQPNEATPSKPIDEKPKDQPEQKATPPSTEHSTETKTKKDDGESFNEGEFKERMKQINSVSAKLGEKLLQGWTMLQEICPVCSVPLMRNREGQMMCLQCNIPVIRQSEFDPKKHYVKDTSSSSTQSSTSAPSTISTSSGDQSNTQVADIVKEHNNNHIRTRDDLVLNKSPSTVTHTSAPSKTMSSAVDQQASSKRTRIDDGSKNQGSSLSISEPYVQHSSQSVETNVDEHVIIHQQAVHTLYRKISAAQHILESSTEVEPSIAACGLITACAQAISALNSIRK